MISIVTVAFNNRTGLEETARSIEAQKCDNFCWIVVDGNSSDGSQQTVARSPRISQLISEPDEGIYDAMRKGLAATSTEYVMFLNAGDVLNGPDALAAASRALGGHDVYFFDTLVESDGLSWQRAARPLRSARYSVPAIQQSTIYRAGVLRQLEWPQGYRVCGDYALAAQLLARGASSQVVHQRLSRFRLGGISTHSVLRLGVEASRVQKQFLFLPLVVRLGGFIRRICTGYVVKAVHHLARLVKRKSA